jgi:YcxB-like protein
MPEQTFGRAPAAAGPAAYDLHYTTSLRDYTTFVLSARRSGAARLVLIVAVTGVALLGALAGVVIATAVAIARGGDPEAVQSYGIVLGVVAIVILHWLFLRPVYFRASLKGQPMGAGETRLRADASAIESDVGGVRIVSPWSSVSRIVERKGLVLVYFARLAAHIVPKRAFASPEDAAAFVKFARVNAPSAES